MRDTDLDPKIFGFQTPWQRCWICPGASWIGSCGALVGIGAALSLGAGEESGAGHQAASVGNLERSAVKESQRAFGKYEQPHSAHQMKGEWISQGYLLSLRWAVFVSTSD